MHRSMKRLLIVLGIIGVGALAVNFLLPFGLPKLPSPNCGPEYRRRLAGSFSSKQDVVAYLQAHEIELLVGYNTPRLGGFPANWIGRRMDVTIDWLSIENDIQVVSRLGYTMYVLKYNHPACQEYQTYKLKITSYGFASLYGCCGI